MRQREGCISVCPKGISVHQCFTAAGMLITRGFTSLKSRSFVLCEAESVATDEVPV